MESIKFRAIWQHSETGRWATTYYTTGELILPPTDRYILVANDMRFTGLVDYLNEEIYEGDILFNDEAPSYCGNRFIVKWSNNDAGFYGDSASSMYKMESWQFKHSEIVGNIYENPELIKE